MDSPAHHFYLLPSTHTSSPWPSKRCALTMHKTSRLCMTPRQKLTSNPHLRTLVSGIVSPSCITHLNDPVYTSPFAICNTPLPGGRIHRMQVAKSNSDNSLALMATVPAAQLLAISLLFLVKRTVVSTHLPGCSHGILPHSGHRLHLPRCHVLLVLPFQRSLSMKRYTTEVSQAAMGCFA